LKWKTNNTILELNRKDELWQIYLFDKIEAKKIDMTDSENEYKTSISSKISL
jgi:hypothetical protein